MKIIYALILLFIIVSIDDCFASDLSVYDVNGILHTSYVDKTIENNEQIEWKFIKFLLDFKVKNVGEDTLNNVNIRISIVPKVGRIAYADPYLDFISNDDTAKTAYWLSAESIKNIRINKLSPNHERTISVDTNLLKIILDYKKKYLWITECIFSISIEPDFAEEELNNNTKEFRVIILTPQD